jgi:peptidyl-prolyl cis-trans isomerase D
MMQNFRKLSNNILFKIFLGFLGLSFIMFGASNFILGGFSQWAAKVDGKKISYEQLQKTMQHDKEIIYNNSGADNEEVNKYLASEQFRNDSLGTIINSMVIEKLKEDLGIKVSKKLILETIATNPNLRGEDGKFSQVLFKDFLRKNGISEEQYVKNLQGELAATMIVQSLSLAAPVSKKIVVELNEFYQEKRIADIITISLNNVANVAEPTLEELEKFFERQKSNFILPATRKIEYLHFAHKDILKEVIISEQEILDEYNKNKDQFQKAENRNFYHIIFDQKEKAQEFVKVLEQKSADDKSKLPENFLNLAKKLASKDKEALTLNNITKKSLIPDLANAVFALNENETSQILQSPLGYHVFLALKINKAEPFTLAEAQNAIKQKLLKDKSDKLLKDKITAIEDELLTSNSLDKTAEKFGFKVNKNLLKIDENGVDLNRQEVKELKAFDDFVKNAFSLNPNQASKLYYSSSNDEFYALMVTEVTESKTRSLDEIRGQVIKLWKENKKSQNLKELAIKVAKEIKENPKNIAIIASKYKLKLERNREFPRMYFIDYQGRKIPYANNFLQELFAVKIGQATSAQEAASQEGMVVGVLKEIKTAPEPSKEQLDNLQKALSDSFKQEILQEHYQYLQKKFPVIVNEKIIKITDNQDSK